MIDSTYSFTEEDEKYWETVVRSCNECLNITKFINSYKWKGIYE